MFRTTFSLNNKHKVFVCILFCALLRSLTLASEGLFGTLYSSGYLCTFYSLKSEPCLLMRTWRGGQILTSFLFFKCPSINPFFLRWLLNYSHKCSSGQVQGNSEQPPLGHKCAHTLRSCPPCCKAAVGEVARTSDWLRCGFRKSRFIFKSA